MARTIHMLNSHGHVTVHWEEQNDSLVLPVIQEMLDKGYKFFILAGDNEHVAATTIDDVAARRIIISDESLEKLREFIQVGGVTIEEDAETTGELAGTPEDVASHDTVATQPMQGG